MVRSPWVDGNGIKRGAWSNEEDQILQDYIRKHGVQNWRGLPKLAGLKRCGKSCRLRWMNYLKPDLKHGRYTKAEEDLVIRMHEQHGNKWALIASKLPGRSDNDIKNYWHTHLEKRVVGPKKLARDNNKVRKSSIEGHISDTSQKNAIMQCGDQIQILESCPLSLSEKLAPSSKTTSSCDISTGSNFSSLDDGGLEEIMQFVEMSPLMSPFEDDSRELMATYEGEFVAQETPITTVDEIYGEVVLEKDDVWSQAFMGNNEVLFSPCLNYDYESFFDGLDLELLEQTMQEMMP